MEVRTKKNLSLKILLSIQLIAFVLGVGPVVAQDDSISSQRGEAFRDAKKGISLVLPPGFAIQKKSEGDILFVAHSGESEALPSVTLVSQMGNPKVTEKSVGMLANDVVDSYRAVGLLDAAVAGKTMMNEEGVEPTEDVVPPEVGEKKKLAGRTVFFTQVNYSRDGVPFTSGIYIFPAAERYFILTMIDTAERLPQQLAQLHRIAATVSIDTEAPASQQLGAGRTAVIWWFVGALTVGLLLFLITWITSRRKR